MRSKSRNQRKLTPTCIVADGAIASHGVADGKLIPVLIIDTMARPDIDELVRIHEHLPPGDASSQWCALKGTRNSVALILKFIRPSEVVLLLNFDLATYGATVDLILKSKALYLQPGKEGDRLSTTVGNKSLLVEVPETGFSEQWQKMRYAFVVKKFRGRGLKRREAKLAATQLFEEFAKLVDFRWK